VIVHVFNEQKALTISSSSVSMLVNQVIKEENQVCHEVSIYFVETEQICELHQQFFDDPSPTDCISFPMDDEEEASHYRILGEVFVCPQTAIEYSQLHQIDPYEETTLYIIHGLLHLMGYRDDEEETVQEMREAEKRQMAALKKLDLCLKPLL
jgi:probable rRNA maturation factor